MQHISDILRCSTVVTVVSQTSYFVNASFLKGGQGSDFKCVVILDDFGRRKITLAA